MTSLRSLLIVSCLLGSSIVAPAAVVQGWIADPYRVKVVLYL